MLYVMMFGSLVLLIGGTALILQSSSVIAHAANSVLRRFPRTVEFCFGALFGTLAGFMPAAAAYALLKSTWVFVAIAAAAAIGCGILWSRWSTRREARAGGGRLGGRRGAAPPQR